MNENLACVGKYNCCLVKFDYIIVFS